jgi:hypothetical protein
MNLKSEIESLKKQIKPKSSIKFALSADEIKAIPGVIWVVYKIKT